LPEPFLEIPYVYYNKFEMKRIYTRDAPNKAKRNKIRPVSILM